MHDMTIKRHKQEHHPIEPREPFWDVQRVIWTIVCAVPGVLVIVMAVAHACGWLHIYH